MTYIPVKDFFIEVGKGNVPGHSIVSLQATNGSVGTSFEDLWDLGGVMTLPTAAETWEIVSDSPNDTAGGTGARTIIVQSLDDSYNEQITPVIPNGTTPVVLTGTHFRPRLMVAPTSGITDNNVGNITLRVSGGGATRGYMTATNGITFSSHYTVPAGKRVMSIGFSVFAPKNDDATVKALLRQFGTDASQISGGSFLIYQSGINLPQRAPFAVASKTDYKLQAKSTNSSVSITAFQDLLEIEDGF